MNTCILPLIINRLCWMYVHIVDYLLVVHDIVVRLQDVRLVSISLLESPLGPAAFLPKTTFSINT